MISMGARPCRGTGVAFAAALVVSAVFAAPTLAQAQAAVQGYSTRLQNQWSWIDGVLNAMNDKVALFDLNQAVSISMNPAEYPYL